MSESERPEGEPLCRRSAIKKVVGGAIAGGVVWSAPRIEGLTLRPNYAAAQTGPPPQVLSLAFSTPSGSTSETPLCSGGTGSFFASASRSPSAVGGTFAFVNVNGTVNELTITADGTWDVERSSIASTGTGDYVGTQNAGVPGGPITVVIEFDCA